MELHVRPNGSHEALADWGRGARRAAIGSGGIGVKGAEGDAITPAGVFPIRSVLFRADRIARPRTGLPVDAIAHDDGWCDAPLDPAYNRPVKLPFRASAEALWREDRLYDLVIILGFNDSPVVPGAGSAVFLHVARPDYSPTQGCIALAMADLQEVLAILGPGDSASITA